MQIEKKGQKNASVEGAAYCLKKNLCRKPSSDKTDSHKTQISVTVA